MSFNPGDVVEIVRPDDVSPEEKHIYDLWEGYRARVSYLPSTSLAGSIEIEFQVALTRLDPIGERPDAREYPVENYQSFYWETKDLRLVKDYAQED